MIDPEEPEPKVDVSRGHGKLAYDKKNRTIRLETDILQERIRELEAEVHRARTDVTYWAEFNTVPADSLYCKYKALEAENAKLRAKIEEGTKLFRAISAGCESALNRINEESK